MPWYCFKLVCTYWCNFTNVVTKHAVPILLHQGPLQKCGVTPKMLKYKESSFWVVIIQEGVVWLRSPSSVMCVPKARTCETCTYLCCSAMQHSVLSTAYMMTNPRIREVTPLSFSNLSVSRSHQFDVNRCSLRCVRTESAWHWETTFMS